MADGDKKGGAAGLAEAIVDGTSTRDLASYVKELEGGNAKAATTAARVMDEIIAQSPNLAAP